MATVCEHLPLRTSQKRTLLSHDAVASVDSLTGSQHSWSTLSVCPFSSLSDRCDSLLRPTLAIASTLHTRADWSTEPVASLRPVQFHATDCTCTHQRRHNK